VREDGGVATDTGSSGTVSNDHLVHALTDRADAQRRIVNDLGTGASRRESLMGDPAATGASARRRCFFTDVAVTGNGPFKEIVRRYGPRTVLLPDA
jgi:hypothetical protein